MPVKRKKATGKPNRKPSRKPVKKPRQPTSTLGTYSYTIEVDFNNISKAVVLAALKAIPYAGGIISGLVGALWPSTVSADAVWNAIRDRVEKLINEKIAESVYSRVKTTLPGLRNVLQNYITATEISPVAEIRVQYDIVKSHFDHDAPFFRQEGYELLLLPLFVHMANMHLSVLRDGVLFGRSWGMNDRELAEARRVLTNTVNDYIKYANDTYQAGLKHVRDTLPTSGPHLSTVRWRIENRFVREMTLSVLDYVTLWPYFDATRYPTPQVVKLTREIYSDPQGTSDDNPIGVNTPPTQPITRVTVWGFERIDAVQVYYGGTPGPRMGNATGGTSKKPYGGDFQLASTGLITGAGGRSGNVLDALQFTFKNNSKSHVMGARSGGGEFFWSFDGHILSSIKIMGVSRHYGTADCVIFGFRFENSY